MKPAFPSRLLESQLRVESSHQVATVALRPVLSNSTRELSTEHILHSHGTRCPSPRAPHAAEDLPCLLDVQTWMIPNMTRSANINLGVRCVWSQFWRVSGLHAKH